MNYRSLIFCLLSAVFIMSSGCAIESLHADDNDVIESLVIASSPMEEDTPDVVVPTPTPAPQPQEYRASLFMTGDALIHGSIWLDSMTSSGYDFSDKVERIAQVASKYDLRYYNQETIIGGDERGPSGYPQFNTPSQWGDAMYDAGFNLVSTATNHCLDQGASGIENSLRYWAGKEGVVTAGTYLTKEDQEAIVVHEINGITYAFFSWTYGMNGLSAPIDRPYMVNCYAGREQEMLDQVAKADKMCDVVIIAMHWGTEYSMSVNDEQHDLARKLSDAGADIIIGNHPHVIEPMEWINGKTICFYAMGNMISAQSGEENLVAVMAGLDIVKTVTGEVIDVKIENVRADLLWTTYRRISSDLVDNVKVYPFNELTDDILWNHEEIYKKYLAILQSLDDSIAIGGV